MDIRRLSQEQRDRIVELHEKGLANAVIAQRVGTTRRHVQRVVKAAKEGSK